ncbi:MAG: hypothetical protein M9928_20455 [Anaerolineae bacterium]|nr:hypothetical protein [Anaerolineae bacterium]
MNVLVVYLSASAASSAYAGTAAPLPTVVESGSQCLSIGRTSYPEEVFHAC